jgi:hypothetical protein
MTRISRRSMLMAGLATVVAGPLRAAALQDSSSSSGSSFFGTLLSWAMSILRAPDQAADYVQRVQLRTFLQQVTATIAKVISHKEIVRFRLNRAACTKRNDGNIAVASEAGFEMLSALDVLGRQIQEFSGAIKPGPIQVQAGEVIAALGRFRANKGWGQEIGGYCRMTAAQRDAVKQEINTSLAYGTACRAALDQLIRALA